MAPKRKAKVGSSAPGKLSAYWDETVRLVPGYDPFRDAAGYYFDEAEAQRRVDFFAECLCHVKGVPGRPAYILPPWEQAIVGNLFGWKSEADGLRRYREGMIYVPRKSDKTNLCAGICLCVLAMDDEPGAEIYGAASTEEQAERLWGYARPMVLADDELRGRFQIYETAKSIVYAAENSVFKILSGVPEGKHGFNSHLIVVDELHEQPNRKLLDALITSMSARRQPLLLHATTADFQRLSVCNEKYAYACNVRDGVIQDPAFLPVIYEVSQAQLKADPECWKKEKYWFMANPNLGKGKKLAYMHRECLRAQHEPSYLNTFLRLELNIQTQQSIHWVDPLAWAACGGAIDEEALRGRPCWAGLDLASTADLCSLALYFPFDGHQVLSYSWVPEAQVKKRAEKGQQDYAVWQRQGFLRTTPGNVADYEYILRDLCNPDGIDAIEALSERFNIQYIAMDAWNSQDLENKLQGAGFNVLRFGQGYRSMSAPCKEVERLYMAAHPTQGLPGAAHLQHGSNPVLTWAAGNAQAMSDAPGNIKLDKEKSADKIDPLVAVVEAVGAYLLKPEVQERSIYETRGLLVL